MSAAATLTSELYGRHLLGAPVPPPHAVQFYDDDAQLIDVVCAYFSAALARGECCVAVATPEHRRAITEALGTHERLVLLDARETLNCFLVDGMPVRERYRATIGPVIRELLPQGTAVRAFGEMVCLLCRDGRPEAALALEGLWNELAEELPFSLLCGYALKSFNSAAEREAFENVCGAHSHVVPASGAAVATNDDAHMRELSALQQRTLALENEIAERNRVEVELRRALRLRDDFLSLASHELRTPLAVLQLQTQALQNEATDHRDRCTRIVRSANRLCTLIEQLFDVTRLGHQGLELERTDVDLGTVVAEVITHLDDDFARHGCSITFDREAVVGRWDSLRLTLVASNLLGNAVKYGRHAPIAVAVRRDGDHAVLSVRDHGIGIAPEDQARVFERFERAAPKENYAGLGLGLWIARTIVEAHGGTIDVSSTRGEGATFTVRLPL
jgi:signal transduction histidine kinase